jgi:hypothetical protein
MDLHVDVAGTASIWKAISPTIPNFFAFGDSPLEAIDNFRNQFGVIEKISFANLDGNFSFTFIFHVTRVLEYA